MTKLRFKISMALDGYVAGPAQSVENPLGVGGSRLHEWAFELALFRRVFRAEGSAEPGFRLENQEWPHGGRVPGVPHGAVFSRP